ncbi:MAG: PHP domain-containing protein [Clostridia bacterium]|nr:PHP domain-containing protein [Clostridia bacterium]
MQYKYELHCHTKETSLCGQVPAAEIVKMYKEQGYNGIVITDHYSPMTFKPSRVYRPQTDIDFYISGYKEALKYADENFTVLLGMELRYYATANDYLVYGVTEEFLRTNGNLMKLYPKKFYKLAKENNMLVVQAHPFRNSIMIRTNPNYLDGAEVHNGKADYEANRKAAEWADKNNMKIRVSGSDFHRPNNLANGGIITDEPIKTNDDLLRILRSGNFEMMGEEFGNI